MGGDDVSTTSPTFINCLHQDQDKHDSNLCLKNVLASLYSFATCVLPGPYRENWQVDVEETMLSG
jgi:hypothetical protein